MLRVTATTVAAHISIAAQPREMSASAIALLIVGCTGIVVPNTSSPTIHDAYPYIVVIDDYEISAVDVRDGVVINSYNRWKEPEPLTLTHSWGVTGTDVWHFSLRSSIVALSALDTALAANTNTDDLLNASGTVSRGDGFDVVLVTRLEDVVTSTRPEDFVQGHDFMVPPTRREFPGEIIVYDATQRTILHRRTLEPSTARPQVVATGHTFVVAHAKTVESIGIDGHVQWQRPWTGVLDANREFVVQAHRELTIEDATTGHRIRQRVLHEIPTAIRIAKDLVLMSVNNAVEAYDVASLKKRWTADCTERVGYMHIVDVGERYVVLSCGGEEFVVVERVTGRSVMRDEQLMGAPKLLRTPTGEQLLLVVDVTAAGARILQIDL